MKNKFLKSAVFGGVWLLYCSVVMIKDPNKRTFVAAAGTIAGVLFLWLTGYLLFRLAKKLRFSALGVGIAVLLLAAADQGAKLLVLRYIPPGNGIELAGDFLAIRFLPNYHNNVLLNLLNIMLPAAVVQVVTVAVLAVVATLFYLYCRRQKYNLKDPRFLLSVTLLASGAVCSIGETALRGYVLDFISFGTLVGFDFKDLYIMYGIGFLIIVFLEWEKELEKKQKQLKIKEKAEK